MTRENKKLVLHQETLTRLTQQGAVLSTIMSDTCLCGPSRVSACPDCDPTQLLRR